jgi:hypothetical protein
MQLTRDLVRNQGLSGVIGFAQGARGVGNRHKGFVSGLLKAASSGDAVAVKRSLGDAEVTVGDNAALTFTQIVELLNGASWSKMIGSGPSIVLSVNTHGVRGVLFVDMDTQQNRIRRIRYFPQ